MVDTVEEIRNALKDDKVLMGTEKVIKGIKNKSVKTVIMSNNAPESVKADIEHYSQISEISVNQVDMNNEELGTLCRRKHNISVLAIL